MRDLKPSEIEAVSGGYFSRGSFFSSFGADRDFDIGSCGGWGSLLEWKPERDLISYDDSGNRYYDPWIGRGTATSDGKFWTDANGDMHMTGWYESQVQNVQINWSGVATDLAKIAAASIGGAGNGARTAFSIVAGAVVDLSGGNR